jgi:WD40 repeat protein
VIVIRFRPFAHAVNLLEFAGPAELVASWRENGIGEVVRWNWPAGKAVRRLDGAVAGVSPGGEYSAVQNPDKTISVYRGRSRKPTAIVSFRRPVHWANLAVAPDGSEVMVARYNRVAFLRLPERKEIFKPVRTDRVLGYSPGGRWVYAVGHLGVRVWDRHSKMKLTKLPIAPLSHFAVASDERTAVAPAPGYHALAVWDLTTREQLATLDHGAYVTAAAVSRDGRRVLGGTVDGRTRLWDAAAGQVAAEYDWGLGEITRVAFAPDGLTAAATGKSGEIVIWDLDG